MKKVMHCVSHAKYTAGCADCKAQARAYRKDQTPRNDETHYSNGQPKKQGNYSDKNWAKFNALGKALTNEKDT